MSPLRGLVAFEEAARKSLEPEAYDYFAGGSWDETSLREAVEAWERFRFRPRVLLDVGSVDTSLELLGAVCRTPVLVAPTGFQRMLEPGGELATAAGARAAGSLFVVSARSSCTLEDIAAVGCPWWYQIYLLRSRDLTEALVGRAAAAGAQAIVLTGDSPVVAPKRRVPGGPLRSGDLFLTNLAPHLRPGDRAEELASLDPSATLDAVGWLAEVSGLPVLVKGVLRGDDAVACLEAGATGIIVSNHGGRQLDRTIPTARALPEVVDAVGGRGPVLVDGGLRDGLAILAALALGAAAVLVGRPLSWALAAAGAEGVEQALEELTGDLAMAMRLAGITRLAGIHRDLLEG